MSSISQFHKVVFFPIKNLKATRSLVSHLVTSPNDCIILPYIDHPGPLASEILAANFRSLTVCEPNPEIRHGFTIHASQYYPEKNIRIHPDDIFDLSFRTHSDAAQNRCAEIVRIGQVSTTERNCDHPVKLLVPLLRSKHEVGFLGNLFYQVCLRFGLCSQSLVQYYFLMSDRQKAYMDARTGDSMRTYRSSSVLYNTIFDMKTLETYNLKKCFGITVRRIQNTVAASNASYSNVHLVKLEPKLDIIRDLGPRSLIEFKFLVTQMMHKRKGLATSFLDRFFSDYRGDVANLGIDDSTRCGDLNKEQYYKLFLYLTKRPDYKSSTFLQAVLKTDDSFSSLDQ